MGRMNACRLFDGYRDGELTPAERSFFESHLARCEDCRVKMSLLNNVVFILKQDEPRPADLAERVARQAFQQSKSWDALLVSWLRPSQALAALALLFVVFSFLWFAPTGRQRTLLSEYETLMNEADAVSLSTSLAQTGNDSEFVLWLQQEGTPQ